MNPHFADSAEKAQELHTCPNCGQYCENSRTIWHEDPHTDKMCCMIVCVEPRPDVNQDTLGLPRTPYYFGLVDIDYDDGEPCFGIVGIWQEFSKFSDLSVRRRKTIVNALYLAPDLADPEEEE